MAFKQVSSDNRLVFMFRRLVDWLHVWHKYYKGGRSIKVYNFGNAVHFAQRKTYV